MGHSNPSVGDRYGQATGGRCWLPARRSKKNWIRFRASRIIIWATNFVGNSGIMSNPMKIREKVVGAKGFEPSTSWSRTRHLNPINALFGVAYRTTGVISPLLVARNLYVVAGVNP